MSTADSTAARWADLPAWAPAGEALREPAPVAGERETVRRHARDEEAFADVFHAEHDRAMRLAYLLAGDRHAAEDAVAEAFVRTYEKWRAGGVERVGPYLRQAVVNQVRNQRRSLARLRRHEDRRRADDRGQALTAEQVAARATLEELLDRLPYRQRAAIVLRYYEDCSEVEIAEALDCRRGTVKSLLFRGMDALRGHAAGTDLERADAGGGA